MENNFAAFILTHGRPKIVRTYSALRRFGYTGKIFLIVDDLDKTKDQYIEEYGDDVIVFSKDQLEGSFDVGDNFGTMRGVIYARNANFQIAKDLGIKYFIQLDDDYSSFVYRFDGDLNYGTKTIRNLDVVFSKLLQFYIESGFASLAIAQGGDFIGGSESTNAENVKLMRKCMNTFICSVDRPFQFIGRINEDTSTYTRSGSTGLLMATTNQVSIGQAQTQKNAGGMSGLYLDHGTYVKSFYSVIYHPSSVTVKAMGDKNYRLHHSVAWKNTVPLILRESVKNG